MSQAMPLSGNTDGPKSAIFSAGRRVAEMAGRAGPGRAGPGRAGPGWVGPGRAGPVHIGNGFVTRKEEFLRFQKFSTMIFKDFSICRQIPLHVEGVSLRFTSLAIIKNV